MRNKKISADISEEASNILNELSKKKERSKGYLIDLMIRKYAKDETNK
jgi:predicted DNA-binding protein